MTAKEERPDQVEEAKKSRDEEILKPIEKVLDGIPEKKRAELKAVFRSILFQGPLPPPDVLREYYEIDPDLSKIIKELPAKEQEHRHRMNEGSLDLKKYQTRTERIEIILGQVFAFLICSFIIGAGTYIVGKGQPIMGGLLTLGGLAGLASVFILGRKPIEKKSPVSDPR